MNNIIYPFRAVLTWIWVGNQLVLNSYVAYVNYLKYSSVLVKTLAFLSLQSNTCLNSTDWLLNLTYSTVVKVIASICTCKRLGFAACMYSNALLWVRRIWSNAICNGFFSLTLMFRMASGGLHGQQYIGFKFLNSELVLVYWCFDLT